jgi:hypothetical protein
MALPVIKIIADCSSFPLTVSPYIPQLYDLPQQILQSWNNPAELYQIYMATNPLVTAFAFSLFLAPLFLLISEINKNYSQVDRMWSILPTIYNAHYALYAHWAGLETQKLDNMLAFSTVWSVRPRELVMPECSNMSLATINLQLLAEGRIQYRVRRLSMVRTGTRSRPCS